MAYEARGLCTMDAKCGQTCVMTPCKDRCAKLVMGVRACIAIMSPSNVIVLSGFKNGSYVRIAVERPPIELLVDG